MAAIDDRDHAGDEGRAVVDGKTVGPPGINRAGEGRRRTVPSFFPSATISPFPSGSPATLTTIAAESPLPGDTTAA